MDLCLLPKITPPHTYMYTFPWAPGMCTQMPILLKVQQCKRVYARVHTPPAHPSRGLCHEPLLMPRDPSHMSGSIMKHSTLSWLSPDGPFPILTVTICKSRCYTVWMLTSLLFSGTHSGHVPLSPTLPGPACLAHDLGRPRLPYSCASLP